MLWNDLVWYPLYAIYKRSNKIILLIQLWQFPTNFCKKYSIVFWRQHRLMLIWSLIMFSEIFSITKLPKKLEPLNMLYNFYICKWYIIKFRNFLYCLKLVPHVYVRLCRHKFRRPTRESSNKDLYFKDKLSSV